MKQTLEKIKAAAMAELGGTNADIEQIRVRYLGKKGELTAVLRGMGQLSPEERPVVGQLANEVRAAIEAAISEKTKELKEKELNDRLVRAS
jgi:phenylalanyl-tRNA synthetase alpha chain